MKDEVASEIFPFFRFFYNAQRGTHQPHMLFYYSWTSLCAVFVHNMPSLYKIKFKIS